MIGATEGQGINDNHCRANRRKGSAVFNAMVLRRPTKAT